MAPEERGIGMLQEATNTTYSPDLEFQQFSFPFENCIRAMMALRDQEKPGYDQGGGLDDEFFGLLTRGFRPLEAA